MSAGVVRCAREYIIRAVLFPPGVARVFALYFERKGLEPRTHEFSRPRPPTTTSTITTTTTRVRVSAVYPAPPSCCSTCLEGGRKTSGENKHNNAVVPTTRHVVALCYAIPTLQRGKVGVGRDDAAALGVLDLGELCVCCVVLCCVCGCCVVLCVRMRPRASA